MKTEINTITINGVEYVEKSSIKSNELAPKLDGLEYVMCRTYSAGVFAGYLKERAGKEVTLLQARRIWYWDGACSLSQLAVDGTTKPSECKFAIEVPSVILTEAVEIIPITTKARKSIDGVKPWKK